MPFISEAASAIKSRFGFHDSSSDSVPVRCTQEILKSASKESVLQSSSEVWSVSEREDEEVVSVGGSASQSFELLEDTSFWKDHNVQVIIRIRPLSSSEISLQGNSKCVRQDSSQTITWTGHPESRFTFDVVADENVSQEKLFKVAGLPMVENCMGGYNSCMFAYGQTGSGKTHTMLGDIEGGTRRHSVNCGMTPRVFECLFSRIQKEKEARREEKLRFTCKCSFLEIYNEQILDLLDPSSVNLQIREDAKKGVYVENLTELEVTSARDVIHNLVQGAANRKVAATNMNRASSRSHSVFTCIIESKWESQGVTHHRFARLNLVDLAGSERQKSSGAEGERLKEATNINKSLSTLGLVIMNLVNISNGKSLHVPYRDSKLTFLLQDSLGGNSKTIIIANISPSNSCSLETLSTLKFAQRAKYIKNNAIVNEDASGDVLAMRMQIQQLKKEVAHLRGIVNGGAENDNWTISFPGSPGSFKWEGLHGLSSPLTSNKRISQKKEYEVALVGAFRREKDKDIALQALIAQNQATMQLAKQREDEIQGLKMRLRFREAGIKRLEGVVQGTISAETHLLKEKEENLKEIEVLRTQVDRNQEVTRFAMENLHLKEEIRRLKSFYEEGEREMMNEQVMVLQNKLLEALDWKLMHESDALMVQNGNLESVSKGNAGDGHLSISAEELSSPWRTSINEENEFLRMQAIQNQAEMDALHKKLNTCLEEKEKLERHVTDLVKELEEEKELSTSKKEEIHKSQMVHPSLTTSQISDFVMNDQIELKTMVDAIASASQREAEAHETAITLAKENDDLRMKIKVLIEDNNKLIELYERASLEMNPKISYQADDIKGQVENPEDHGTGSTSDFAKEKEVQMQTEIENLEQQIMDLHEENEKLMGLYEKAMKDRDECKRLLFSSEQSGVVKGEFECPEKLAQVDEGKFQESEDIDVECLRLDKLTISDEAKTSMDRTWSMGNEIELINNFEDINLVRTTLQRAEEKLLILTTTLSTFGLLEKAMDEVDKLSRELDAIESGVQVKNKEFQSLKVSCLEKQEKKALIDRKLLALKYAMSSFCSSIGYFEQREAQARERVKTSYSFLNQRKYEFNNLQAKKDEIETVKRGIQQSEYELKDNIICLKSKLEEEIIKQETEKVLLPIDNVQKMEPRNWKSSVKASELLKSEEETIRLQNEMKKAREELVIYRKEMEDLDKRSVKLENEMERVEADLKNAALSVEEMENGLQSVIKEKKMLMDIGEKGRKETDSMIVEFHQRVFEVNLKEEEMKILEEELKSEVRQIEELKLARISAKGKKDQLSFLSKKMEEELKNVGVSLSEAKSLLEGAIKEK